MTADVMLSDKMRWRFDPTCGIKALCMILKEKIRSSTLKCMQTLFFPKILGQALQPLKEYTETDLEVWQTPA